MELIDPETRREVDEVQRLERDISRFTSGVLSEPTTPPEHHNRVNTSAVPYSNRFSASFMSSSPSISTRPSRSGTQLTPPGLEPIRLMTSEATPPLRSVPTSQLNSDHDDSDDDYALAITDSRLKAGAKYVYNDMSRALSAIRSVLSRPLLHPFVPHRCQFISCIIPVSYTHLRARDRTRSRMPSSA